jgi:hypothetical protein
MRIICRKLDPKDRMKTQLAGTIHGHIGRIWRRWSSIGGQRIYCRDSTLVRRFRIDVWSIVILGITGEGSPVVVEIELPNVFPGKISRQASSRVPLRRACLSLESAVKDLGRHRCRPYIPRPGPAAPSPFTPLPLVGGREFRIPNSELGGWVGGPSVSAVPASLRRRTPWSSP